MIYGHPKNNFQVKGVVTKAIIILWHIHTQAITITIAAL